MVLRDNGGLLCVNMPKEVGLGVYCHVPWPSGFYRFTNGDIQYKWKLLELNNAKKQSLSC